MEYKKIFLPLFLIPCSLFLILVVSASPTLQLQNEQIQPGETIFCTITTLGEFTSQIEKSQIKFFQGRKQITLETDILFYNQTHYLAIYTTQETNLTLQIENILYKEADQLQSITIIENLSIQKNILFNKNTNETYTQILKIKPGHIFSSTQPKLKLTNVGTANLNLTFNEQEISLSPLSSQELNFTPTETFTLTKVSTYKDFLVPTVYLKSELNTTFISPTTKLDLRADPDLLFIELFTENETTVTIQLFNFADQNLTDIKIAHNTSFLEITELENFQPKGIQNLTLKLGPENPGHFQGTINISYMQNENQNILQIPLSIFVLSKGTPKENFQIIEKTCEEMLGQVCKSGAEICNKTPIFTKNLEYCCLGSCVSMEEESSSGGFGWLVGIVILIVLVLIGYSFYKKQQLFQSPTSKDALATTTKSFESRISGNQTKRTVGDLTKF